MTSPLADRLRPNSLTQLVGQNHIINKNHWVNNIDSMDSLPNIIIYGPPGTGKTTFSRIIAKQKNKKFFKLNATNCSLTDIKDIIKDIDTLEYSNGIVLYIDEIQYFNKKQQQSLLEFIENGKITLIASTTENPYFFAYPSLLSRCQILEFKPIEKEDIKHAIIRACEFLEAEKNIKISITSEALDKISSLSFGDVRKAINIFEICFYSSKTENNQKIIDYDTTIKSLEENSLLNHNKTGDEHFDLLSAFQKSMRGSDPNASIYYLARLLTVGEITSVCRRILVCACEDVGLAYPQIFNYVKSLTDIAMQVGMPEARIPLSDAVLLIALSPKSNSTYKAINQAMNDIKNGMVCPIPEHLSNHSSNYKYPFDYLNNWVSQQYLPNDIKNKKYYHPQDNKNESIFANYWNQVAKK